jgi:hypothetical protein
MRLRIGFVSGFALGYYLGAMAGRDRYEQINRIVREARGSNAIEGAADKARAVVDLGKERARDVVGSKSGDGANGRDLGPKDAETPI